MFTHRIGLALGRAQKQIPSVGTIATALGVSALLVMLTWSSITDARHMVADFAIDAWSIKHQTNALHQGTFPTLSLTADTTAFYPLFAFYGGTLFAFGAVIALLVGSANAAETIICLLALAGAYGGWFWLARLAGLRSWQAHAPAILYVTAPYVLTNINVRQDLAELVATAAIPLLLASALSVLRADRLRAGPAAALAISTIVFSGSHNLTLLWGLTVLAIAALTIAAVAPPVRRQVTKRGVLRVLAIVVPAMAVNAWYLLPDLAYQADTVIAHRIDDWKALLRASHPELQAKYLFAIGHPTAFRGSGLTLVLPVVAMAWVLVAIPAALAQRRGTWARVLAVLVLLTAALLVVMVHPRWILALPDPWVMIQFSYRLMTFVLFGICGAVIAALVLLNNDRHRWRIWLLLPILILSIVGASAQRHDAPRAKYSLAVPIDTSMIFSVGDYADGGLRKLRPGPRAQSFAFTRANVRGGVIDLDVRAAPHEVIYTNLMTPSRMIDVQGARVVGRWGAPPYGRGWQVRWGLALRLDDNATPGAAHIVIRQARSLPIVAGRIISILGLLCLAAIAAVIAHAAWRRRQEPLLRSTPRDDRRATS